MKLTIHPDGSAVLVVSPAEVYAERGFIARLVGKYGVRDADIPDIVQDVMIVVCDGAWDRLIRGKPAEPARDVLRAYIVAVTWRRVANYRTKVNRRGKYAAVMTVANEPRVDPADMLDAREALRIIATIDPQFVRAAILAGLGATLKEGAADMGVQVSTYHIRVLIGRDLARRAVKGPSRHLSRHGSNARRVGRKANNTGRGH